MRIWMLTGKRKVFTSTWKTDNTSSSSSTDHQIKLPLESTGTYNFIINWGDGIKNHITAYNQAEATHTYGAIGTYTIKIIGVCKGFRFNNSGDKLKILEIKKWGKLNVGNSKEFFYGCENLQVTAHDMLDNTDMDTLNTMFGNCKKLDYSLRIDSKNINNTRYMYYGCSLFNSSVEYITLENVDDMQAMFLNCTLFNKYVNHFNLSKMENMRDAFSGCANFNQLVNNWVTGTVENMSYLFKGCTLFNQDISTFDLTNMDTMAEILTDAVSWSTENYDKFLISAAAQAVKDGVLFKCSTKYTSGGAAEAARTYLTGVKSWTISDGGAA